MNGHKVHLSEDDRLCFVVGPASADQPGASRTASSRRKRKHSPDEVSVEVHTFPLPLPHQFFSQMEIFWLNEMEIYSLLCLFWRGSYMC